MNVSPSPDDAFRNLLLEHEGPFLKRDPERVSGKFARMARSAYSYFRGTAWMSRDVPSRFITPASSRVAVIGDPHPENIGTFIGARGDRVLEFNDFDLAGYGSYMDDLRRLAVGVWIVGDMADLKRKARDAAVAHMVDGYVAEVAELARGQSAFALRESAFGGHLEDILVAPEDDEFAKGQPLTQTEDALLNSVLSHYVRTRAASRGPGAATAQESGHPETDGGLRIKQAVRRNAGVASFALLRFQAMVAGLPDAKGHAIDVVLEIKESMVPPASRIVTLQRQFYGSQIDDPWLGWAAAGGREFRVRGVSPAQRRLSADHMANWLENAPSGNGDLRDWAFAFGRLLAAGHCTALDDSGHPGLAAIKDALTNGSDLAAEMAAYAEQRATANKTAMKAFRELLAKRGPLLGWQATDPHDAGTP